MLEESVIVQKYLKKGMARGMAKGLAKGEVRGAKKALEETATERFGPPDAAAVAALKGIGDYQRVLELTRRVLHVTSWHELLDLPAPRGRTRRPRQP
jgi:hypothetical protein